jgi:cytochrome b6-f complex iron-sulfur subunit
MKRREFTQWVGLGLLSSSLPIAIAACKSDPTVDSGAGAGFASLGTVADLDAAGVLAQDGFQGKNVAVIRNPDSPDTLIAVDARCTHAGCTVNWERDRGLFLCPCHGSQFATDGSAQSGPTQKPLALYAAKIEDDQVWVKV